MVLYKEWFWAFITYEARTRSNERRVHVGHVSDSGQPGWLADTVKRPDRTRIGTVSGSSLVKYVLTRPDNDKTLNPQLSYPKPTVLSILQRRRQRISLWWISSSSLVVDLVFVASGSRGGGSIFGSRHRWWISLWLDLVVVVTGGSRRRSRWWI